MENRFVGKDRGRLHRDVIRDSDSTTSGKAWFLHDTEKCPSKYECVAEDQRYILDLEEAKKEKTRTRTRQVERETPLFMMIESRLRILFRPFSTIIAPSDLLF